MRFRTLLPVALCLLAIAPGVARSQDWKLFESHEQQFSVRYPGSWNLLENQASTHEAPILDIINFPNSERAEGVVLKRGGAWISASAAPPGVQTINDWVHGFGKDDVILEQRNMPLPQTSPRGCLELKRVMARSEVGPGAYFIYTEYYCRTANGLFGVLLTNWEGDPHQNDLQKTALKMALSLRTLPHARPKVSATLPSFPSHP